MDQSAPADQVASSGNPLPRAWIEIHRGRTRFRRRPFPSDRFLIGSGSNCDLQLGGQGIPILHSLIHISEGRLRIEAFVSEPPLVVGGRTVRSAVLSDHDLIEIGSFSLTAHHGLAALQPPRDASDDLHAPLDVAAILDQQSPEFAVEAEVPRLSASQLVDRIESELAAQREAGLRTRAGMAGLIDAARAWAGAESSREIADLEAVIRQIDVQAAGIAEDARALREREQALAAQSDLMLALHDRVIAECAEILDQAGRAEGEFPSRLRLSA